MAGTNKLSDKKLKSLLGKESTVTLAQIQCSAKSEIFVFLETSDKFSRSHVI